MDNPKQLPVRVRQAQKEDENFIYSSFLKSYLVPFLRHAGGEEVIAPRVFFTGFHGVLKSLMSKRVVLVACPEDAPEVICGYILGDNLSNGVLVLDYIYVKKDFCGMGIARMLYEALGGSIGARVAFTLWHAKAPELLRTRCESFQYVPHFVLESWRENDDKED